MLKNGGKSALLEEKIFNDRSPDTCTPFCLLLLCSFTCHLNVFCLAPQAHQNTLQENF